MKKQMRGVTLIELMVVIVIIGILMAIAVPQYGEYVQRSQIVEATSALSDLRTRAEQSYQDNRTYGPAGVAVAAVGWSGNCRIPAPDQSSIRYFNYDCAAAAGGLADQDFVLTATGRPGTRVSGLTLTLNQNNQRRTTAGPAGFATPANCWLTKKGATC